MKIFLILTLSLSLFASSIKDRPLEEIIYNYYNTSYTSSENLDIVDKIIVEDYLDKANFLFTLAPLFTHILNTNTNEYNYIILDKFINLSDNNKIPLIIGIWFSSIENKSAIYSNLILPKDINSLKIYSSLKFDKINDYEKLTITSIPILDMYWGSYFVTGKYSFIYKIQASTKNFDKRIAQASIKSLATNRRIDNQISKILNNEISFMDSFLNRLGN